MSYKITLENITLRKCEKMCHWNEELAISRGDSRI